MGLISSDPCAPFITTAAATTTSKSDMPHRNKLKRTNRPKLNLADLMTSPNGVSTSDSITPSSYQGSTPCSSVTFASAISGIPSNAVTTSKNSRGSGEYREDDMLLFSDDEVSGMDLLKIQDQHDENAFKETTDSPASPADSCSFTTICPVNTPSQKASFFPQDHQGKNTTTEQPENIHASNNANHPCVYTISKQSELLDCATVTTPVPHTLSSPIISQYYVHDKFSQYIDARGRLNFCDRTIIDSTGCLFPSTGKSYSMRMTDFQLLESLGKGSFGCVQRVKHLPSNEIMAMKEIRLELDPAKLKQILMELEILHQSKSEFIVDFYGAFFVESCVYFCMEYMDCGSLDMLYRYGMEEQVLGKIAASTVRGLKFLKESLSIIHRDVKPTNILVNSKGQVKLCDFGVSGQLNQSMAKTNVGCQSYMAPERINYLQATQQTYSVQSDVWSLGMTLLEMALGHYPFLNDQFDSVFAQLSAIVNGKLPDMPNMYSPSCRDFVTSCLHKNPKDRPGYAQLLLHPWLNEMQNQFVNMAEWATQSKNKYDQDRAKTRPLSAMGHTHHDG